MIILLLFIALFVGVNVGFYHNWLWMAIAILFSGYTFLRIPKKHFFVVIGAFFLGAVLPIGFMSIPQKARQIAGIVYEAKENYFLIQSFSGRYYVSSKEHHQDIGNIISMKGYTKEIKFISLESQFDFTSYLQKKGVRMEFVATEFNVLLKNILQQKTLIEIFLAKFPEECRPLLGSIVFLQSDENLYEQFSIMGITYLLGALGLYVMILKRIMEKGLGLLIRKAKICRTITNVFLFSYFVFLPIKLFIWRFVFFGVANYLFVRSGKKLTYHNGLSLLGIILLIINPYFALQLSFIYSFSLLFLIQVIKKIRLSKKRKRNRLIQGGFIYGYLLLLQIFTNYEVNILFPIFQVVLTPLFIVLFLVGIFSFYLFPLPNLIKFIVIIVNFSISFCQHNSIIIVIGGGTILVGIILILIFGVVIYFARLKLRKMTILTSFLFLTICFGQSIPFENFFTAEIAFINVGQGDAIFIRSRQTTMLVDTGGNKYIDLATECLIPFLKKRKVRSLDYLVTTHNDFDHLGARESLIRNYRVKKLLSAKNDFPLTFGKTAIHNLNDYFPDDSDNNKSLVLYFSLGGHDFLLMGDLEREGEERIIAKYPHLSVDYIKLGHHGSSTSSTKKFLNAVQPKLAIISVGKNSYGHPHLTVLDNLNDLLIPYWRTDEKGTIRFRYREWL